MGIKGGGDEGGGENRWREVFKKKRGVWKVER